ncbi:MAG: asparagine synthase-related protein [Candidatus Acidiferrales bacterium]
MSGIAGLYRRDGAPADRGLIDALTRFLSFVGPDARNTWASGAIALGHTLLATTREAKGDAQPASLEGKFWIVADARIDARDELATKLAKFKRSVREDAADVEWILQAYAAWGPSCVEYLRGDFAFAIWDADSKSLFCARDHFGVRPFYYAELRDQFVFSNVLDCVRLHPEVSAELNDAAVADFLLFGLNCNVGTTTFRDVQRLPPAHTLTASTAGIRIERYWSAPTDGYIRYKDVRAYAEHFNDIFQPAVADRLRNDRVAILMSGGLDSAAVAATARDASRSAKPGSGADIHAFTMVYESLFADDEGRYARELAEYLQIPIECMALDRLRPFEGWPAAGAAASNQSGSDLDGGCYWPEPVGDPFMAGLFVQFGAIAKTCRVALSGDGNDNLMHFEMWPYTKSLVRRSEWNTLALQLPAYLRRRKSPLRGALRRVTKIFGNDELRPEIPKWVSSALVDRLKLKDRAAEWCQLTPSRPHPVLPRGHASLSLPQWSNLFEMQNAGVTKCPVEMRHPFLDLRVVNFLLSLPPFPLYMEKKLLREALAGRVPESVRTRKKTPLAGDPLGHFLKQSDSVFPRNVKWAEEMDGYVDTSKWECLTLEETKIYNSTSKTNRIESFVRPICLNFWLQSTSRVRYNLHAEARNG